MRRRALLLGLLLACCACRRKVTPPAPLPPVEYVAATLRTDGVTFSLARGPVGTGCTGTTGVTVPRASGPSYDFAAVTRCARTLKTTEPGLATTSTITIDAANETPYQDVVSLLDAVRSDAAGPLFSDVKLALPAPPAASPKPSSAPTTAAKLVAGGEAVDGTPVIVTKKKILVEDEEIRTYGGPATVLSGLPAAEKRGGAAGFYVDKLGAKLAPACAMTRKIREAKKLDPAAPCDLVLVADTSIPYRVLVEVLATAAESGFGEFHLMVLQGAKR